MQTLARKSRGTNEPRARKPSFALLAIALCLIGASGAGAENFRVLVINQVGAWPHSEASIDLQARLDGLAVAMDFGLKHVNNNTDSQMVPDTLNRYQVIILNNTSSVGAVIHGAAQRLAFQEWLKRGHGIVAIHDVMDHADLWPWITDSVFGRTRFTQWSGWNSSKGQGAKVKWDDIAVNGEVRADKPEYARLKAGIPGSATKAWFTYPDEWSSYTVNPREQVDVLMRIDENTYDVPERMGDDHPIAWATHMPALSAGGRQGRFIYTSRGHAVPAYSGKGSGSAPNDVWADPAAPTYNFIKWSICWAAAASGAVDESCEPQGVPVHPARSRPASLRVRGRSGSLAVSIRGTGRFAIAVFDVAGHPLARAEGSEGEFAFPGLKGPGLYLVKARDGAGETYLGRLAL
jgi:hypothetical protein